MKIKWNDQAKQHMELRTREGVPYLAYPEFEQMSDLLHGFSTREGGVSQGVLSTMNLSFSRGDKEENVQENFRRMGKALGFTPEQVVCSVQTHTTNVRVVTEADMGKGLVKPQDYGDIDGLVTNIPGIVLATFYADCVPLFLVDPVKKAIGLSHSGWRGTVGKMGKATIEVMTREYGTNPGDVIAAIGPSICQDCYEVSKDVADEFTAAFTEEKSKMLLKEHGEGKYLLDLWKANELVFLEAGVKKEQILLPGICTCCNPSLLFSHRASKGQRGNLAAFLGIKKEKSPL